MNEDITTAVIDDDTSDVDNILDTEHDVFNDFIPEDADPSVDVLDSITVEGSPALQVWLSIDRRKLIWQKRVSLVILRLVSNQKVRMIAIYLRCMLIGISMHSWPVRVRSAVLTRDGV